MTKLEGVNWVLRGVGMAGTAALDTSGNSDAAHAERILDEVEQEIQSRGWYYNTRCKVSLTPDGSDNILLPDGVLTIDSDYTDAWRKVTQVGGKLYDLDNNTDEFEGNLIVTYVLRYDFGCIPPPIQHYIACVAAMRFNETPRGHPTRRVKLARDEASAQAMANRFDQDTSDTNILHTNDAEMVRGRRHRARW